MISSGPEHAHCRDMMAVHMRNAKHWERSAKALRKALRAIDQASAAPQERLRQLADEALDADKRRQQAYRDA